MTLAQLRYLIALDEHRSYVKAAAACELTQPALTMQIKKLEEELNLILFDRTKKPILTTLAGKKLVEQARRIVLESRKMHDLAEELSQEFTGTIKIGIIPTLAPYLVPLFIKEFQEQHPHITVLVQEALTEQILHELQQGELDAGIIVTPVKTKGIQIRPLFYERFFIYVSEKHPLYSHATIDPHTLSIEEVWVLQEGNCFRTQVEHICQAVSGKARPNTFHYESHSIESLRRIVSFRRGLTFLPELATLGIPAEQEEMIKELTPPPPTREISLVSVPPFLKQGLIDLLVPILLSQIPAHMKQKPEGELIDTGIEL